MYYFVPGSIIYTASWCSSVILSEVMMHIYIYTSILTGVRSTYFNVRSKTVPYCLSGKCIGTPTQVLCVILFGLRAIPCVESVTSVVCLCVARLCVVAMFLRYLCRRIDHPSKAKQERLMLFRRGKGVIKFVAT